MAEKEGLTKVTGIVDSKSSKWNGGLNINDTWYNGTDRTKNFVQQVNKGDKVELDVNDSNKIVFVKVLEKAPEPDQDSNTASAPAPKVERSKEERAIDLAEVAESYLGLMKLSIVNATDVLINKVSMESL